MACVHPWTKLTTGSLVLLPAPHPRFLVSNFNFTEVWIQNSGTHCPRGQPGRNLSSLLQSLRLSLDSRLFQQDLALIQWEFRGGKLFPARENEGWPPGGGGICMGQSGQTHREKRKQYTSKQVEVGKHSMYRNKDSKYGTLCCRWGSTGVPGLQQGSCFPGGLWAGGETAGASGYMGL